MTSNIAYADDVDIGTKSGIVYFVDATDLSPDGANKREILYTFVLDYLRGKKTGRLLQFDPSTGKVDVLADDMYFVNGIAVDDEEAFIMIAELFRLLKYHLTGPKKGQIEVMATNLTGLLDGADCSGSYCYAAVPSSCPSIVKILLLFSPTVEAWIKTFVMMLPKSFSPKPKRYGGIVEVLPGDESSTGHVNRLFQDPEGEHIHMINGVTEHNGKLYLGSLETNYVGVLDLGVSIDNSAPFFIFSD